MGKIQGSPHYGAKYAPSVEMTIFLGDKPKNDSGTRMSYRLTIDPILVRYLRYFANFSGTTR